MSTELARETSIDLSIVAITLLCIALVAASVWWSAFCQRKFCRR